MSLDIDRVIAGYLACALWASADEDGEPLDDAYRVEDFSIAARAQARDDCADFLSLCEREGLDVSSIPPERFGHDFWLTRNGHGAGFWDRGLGALGDTLTTWAKAAGTRDVIETDADELEFTP